MRLSLRFIASRLTRIWAQTEIPCDAEGKIFSSVRLYTQDSIVSPHSDCIFIVPSAQEPEKGLERCTAIIWVGTHKPPKGKPCIWIKEHVDLVRILDNALIIFDLMNEWKSAVQHHLLVEDPISEVVNTLSLVITNPFFYCDAGLKMLAISRRSPLTTSIEVFREQIETGYLPPEIVAGLVSSGDLDIINKKKSAWLFEGSETFKTPFVSRTIFCQGGVFGHLFVIEENPEYALCDTEILEELGSTISDYLDHRYPHFPTRGRYYEQSLKDLLSGRVLANDVDNVLTIMKWERFGNYQVLVFEAPDSGSSSRDTSKTQLSIVEETLGQNGIILGSNVVVLINIGNQLNRKETVNQIKKSIQGLCARFGWRAGISDVFNDIIDAKPYYDQAFAALTTGMLIDPDLRLYEYYRYLIHFIRATVWNHVDSPLLHHGDILALIAYDEETNSRLAETLYIYLLNERKVAKTSEVLYMHRNSVINRIHKIEQLIVSDLNDPDDRLSLLISLDIAHTQGLF